jgi:hypothetical protein
MKRYQGFFFALVLSLAALLPFACESDDIGKGNQPLDGNAIRFAAGAPVRSSGDQTATNMAEMAVFAYRTQGDWDEGTSLPNFMYNQSVTQSGGSWTYAPPKYWPSAGGSNPEKLSFFAVSPVPSGGNGIVPLTGSSDAGYPAFTVTPPASPAAQADFCVATPVMNALSTTYAGGQVPFAFDHAMAKVTFSAQYDSSEDLVVAVGEIKLKGLISSHTLRLTSTGFAWDAFGASPTTADYTLSTLDNTLVCTRLSNATSTLVSTDAGALMLIPQTISTAQIEVTLWVGSEKIVRTANMPSAFTFDAGETYNYSLTINDTEMRVWDYDYTGNHETFVAPETGDYKLEVWGAAGTSEDNWSYGGNGGYSAGKIHLEKDQSFYIYVGQSESTPDRKGTFNGGATIVARPDPPAFGRSGAGGGATDIRLVSGAWNDDASLNSRILVAGGGGGGAYDTNNSRRGGGGAGGGLTGGKGIPVDNAVPGNGGTQIAGGAGVTTGGISSSNASFGKGSAGNSNTNVAGGGGGYYGGSGSARGTGVGGAAGGGGGSSFVSGMANCVAIDPTINPTSNPRTKDTGGDTTALNYISAFGPSPTWNDSDEIRFTDCSMIDGDGYGGDGTKTGMPDPSGCGCTMTGNTGPGHARITLLP